MGKYKFLIIGMCITILGIGMFIFGASLFTYQGQPLNPVINKLGMYSFFLWLPTICVGIFLIVRPLNEIFHIQYPT
jgi:hypothetical protein